MATLHAWESFYVIVGSAAGALIGLQFVVMTLIAGLPIAGTQEGAAAFGTPTIVHLGTALLLAAIQAVPWGGLGAPAGAWGVVGGAGFLYTLVVARRMRRTSYRPGAEDWLFHFLLPALAYAAVAAAAVAIRREAGAGAGLMAIGGAALLLLFIGIHNAWDTVTYHVFVSRQTAERADPPRSGEA
jgi:hypothetical protein